MLSVSVDPFKHLCLNTKTCKKLPQAVVSASFTQQDIWAKIQKENNSAVNSQYFTSTD